MTNEHREMLQNLKVSDISDVYSGTDGKCCCGCSGNYVSDGDMGFAALAKRRLRELQADENTSFFGNGFARVVGKRLHSIYLKGK